MRIEPLGDAAAILRDLEEPAYLLAERINARPPRGIEEAVASYDTVGVYFDPAAVGIPDIESAVQSIDGPQPTFQTRRTHLVPICYEMGEDMEAVCSATGLSKAEVAAQHSGQAYTCFAVGFCPGFPYLGYLPESIAGLPRLRQPRTRVNPGAVGITGRQTGIYPLPRPGGWHLIGRTPLTIVDVEERYFPIVAGDEIRFEPISRDEFLRLEGARL
jgi:inhibitor of KinA